MTNEIDPVGQRSEQFWRVRGHPGIAFVALLILVCLCGFGQAALSQDRDEDPVPSDSTKPQAAPALIRRAVPTGGTEARQDLLEEYWVEIVDGKDVKHGRSRKWNGKPYMVIEDSWYSHGKLHGPSKTCTLVYEDSKPSAQGRLVKIIKEEIDYVDGLKHGWSRRYDVDGKQTYEVQYDLGRSGVMREWSRSGALVAASVPLDDDSTHGGKGLWVRRRWAETGQIVQESFTQDGVSAGLYRTWYLNGQLQDEVGHKEGKMSGPRKYWNPDGSLKWVQEYKDGKIVKQQNYKDGQPDGEPFDPK